MSLPPPINELPIYGDDEDDDGVKVKYLSNQPYTEILYSPIEVNLILVADVDNTHPHLFDGELQFVDFAIRKILRDDHFSVWDVEVESHHIYNVHTHPAIPNMFQCDYQGIFSVVSSHVHVLYCLLLLLFFSFAFIICVLRTIIFY
jgi:hypothetical protein